MVKYPARGKTVGVLYSVFQKMMEQLDQHIEMGLHLPNGKAMALSAMDIGSIPICYKTQSLVQRWV